MSHHVREATHAGVRFEARRVDGSQGPRHTELFHARPNASSIVAIFRGHDGASGESAARLCQSALARVLDEPASPLPEQPAVLLAELAGRIDETFRELRLGGRSYAFGVIGVVAADRAWFLRRGHGRVLRVRGGRVSTVVEEHSLGEPFMEDVALSAFPPHEHHSETTIDIAIEPGDRLLLLPQEVFGLADASYASVDALLAALAEKRPWAFVAITSA
jgi:hypothetical protein